MHVFDYSSTPAGLLNPQTMNLVSAVHEAKGRQIAHLSVRPEILDSLVEIAKIQSTDASNNIEGIHTSDKRLREIMSDKTDLRTRDEEEIAGYRDVLELIHTQHDYIEPTAGVILQLHRNLYRRTSSSMGGHYKIGDNEIRGVRPDGSQYVRFRTAPAIQTPEAVDALCNAYRDNFYNEDTDPLLLSLMFVFDFTCIHPFNDGNGRMSRLLTLLLLYRCGYLVGKYISIEKEIERTKGDYCDALALSSQGWSDNANDPGPFVRYMLGVILAAYRDLDERVLLLANTRLSKARRIEAYLEKSIGKVTKQEIAQALPDISLPTIQRTLKSLLDQGQLVKTGNGRTAGYVWNFEGDARP